MAVVKPFGALRFTPDAGEISELCCPPYDIISEEERRGFLRRNAHNIIRLELPREGENPYQTAGETLEKWIQDGILRCDDLPALYIYEEEFTAYGQKKRVKGFMCRVGLEEFSKGVVLPHEETLSKAKADRFDLMRATGCNFSSIYSLYFDKENAIYPRIDALSARDADISLTDGDGAVHRVWIAADMNAIGEICDLMASKKLYIADGHHRYETALNYREYLREQGTLTPEHPANYIMMTLVHMEHEGLVVFPTHRIVRGLPGFDAKKLLADCGDYFEVSACAAGVVPDALAKYAAEGKKAFALYTDGAAYLLVLKKPEIMTGLLPDESDAYRNLDVSIFHTLILERLLGIDKENMANQKNLIYTRDAAEAVAAVDRKDADCAFIINPTGVDEIAAVAGNGEKMPQKSTYFYPKVITGHVMNSLR